MATRKRRPRASWKERDVPISAPASRAEIWTFWVLHFQKMQCTPTFQGAHCVGLWRFIIERIQVGEPMSRVTFRRSSDQALLALEI